jgi:hypothetical protein
MAYIDQLVQIQITATTKTPTEQGFGTPLIMAQKVPSTWGSHRVRSFADASDVLAAGFLTSDAAYKLASVISSQSPRVGTIKIGQRATSTSSRIYQLTFTSCPTGATLDFVIDGEVITHLITETDVTTLAANVAGLISGSGPSAVSASALVGVLTLAASNSGIEFAISGFYESKCIALLDISAFPDITSDLAACLAEDSDFYGVVLDGGGATEITEAATWMEANTRIMACEIADSGCLDPESTSDIMYTAKGEAFTRTCIFATTIATQTGLAAGILGSRLPAAPGSDTWAWKTIASVPVNAMEDAEIEAVQAKNGNVYIVLAGLNETLEGKSPSGVWMDQVRGIDWMRATMQTRCLARLASAPGKIAFTDAGISSFAAVIEGVIQDGITVGFIASTPAYVVTQPTAASIDPSIKNSRRLPGISFSATMAGAIHGLDVTGSLDA